MEWTGWSEHFKLMIQKERHAKPTKALNASDEEGNSIF